MLLVTSVVGFVQREITAEGGTGPAEAGTISIVDFAFDPEQATASVGDTVTWINDDGAAHTVTSDGEGPLDSGDMDPGATYEATFAEPGTYDYICTIHPTMQATIEVTS